MKKYLVAASILVLSAGVASAQQSRPANANPKGIGGEVRIDAHAQHDTATKGIGGEVSTRARAQRTTATPTPSPTSSPSPLPSPTGTTPTGPAE